MNTGRHTLEIINEAKWYNNWLFSIIKEYLGKNILEVGAGTGNFTGKLMLHSKVTALDLDPRCVKDLKEKFGKRIISGVGDIERGEYFFNGLRFDTIVCLNVLEHIKNDQKALKNIKNLLKDNGILILLVPAHRWLSSRFDIELGHFRRYEKKDIEDMLKDLNFKIYDFRYLNWWAAIGWFVFIKIFKVKSMPKSPVRIFDTLAKIFLFPERFIAPPFGLSILTIAKKEDITEQL